MLARSPGPLSAAHASGPSAAPQLLVPSSLFTLMVGNAALIATTNEPLQRQAIWPVSSVFHSLGAAHHGPTLERS